MSQFSIICVTSKTDSPFEIKNDPFFQALQHAKYEIIIFNLAESIVGIAKKIICSVTEAKKHKYSPIVMFNVFLDPENENVFLDKIWNPPYSDLKYLLRYASSSEHFNSTNCLKSLKLFWYVWRDIRSISNIIITTDGYNISEKAEVALAHAFSSPRACILYNWSSSRDFISSLIRDIKKQARLLKNG